MPTTLPVANTHLSLTQAALKIGRTRQFVLSLAAAGSLSPTMMGGRLFFPLVEVDALARRLAASEAAPSRPRKRPRSRA